MYTAHTTPAPAAAAAPYAPPPQQYQGNMEWNVYDHEDLYNAQVRVPSLGDSGVYKQMQPSFPTPSVLVAQSSASQMAHVASDPAMYYESNVRPGAPAYDGYKMYGKPSVANVAVEKQDFQLYPTGTSSGAGTASYTAPAPYYDGLSQMNCGGFTAPMSAPEVHSFPAVSAQELLNFYAASSAAAITQNSGGMPWAMNDEFESYMAQ